MENTGVSCNVCECIHHCGTSCCDLAQIQITHEKTSANSMDTPHFCKSYCQKQK